jgi:hypothetical protein
MGVVMYMTDRVAVGYGTGVEGSIVAATGHVHVRLASAQKSPATHSLEYIPYSKVSD